MTEVFGGFAFQQSRWSTEGAVVLMAGKRLGGSNGFWPEKAVVLCLRMTVKLKSLSALSKKWFIDFDVQSKSVHLIQTFELQWKQEHLSC